MGLNYSIPSNTCVLLKVPSIQSFSTLFTDYTHSVTIMISEGKISTYEISAVNRVRKEDNCACKQCCAVGLYAMCYSVAKPYEIKY